MPNDLRLADFDFDLPAGLIAQRPLADRAASRLLHLAGRELDDLHFSDLPGLLQAGDLLLLNDTRVIKARLLGAKPNGGRVEALIERVLTPRTALALLRTSHSPRLGQKIDFTGAQAVVTARTEDLFELQFDCDVAPLLERIGQVPLPPYIEHAADALDEARYQTVYARQQGAVAAPTAGLHLTEALLERLRERGVVTAFITLHVGAGTFAPVRSERVADHVMHAELYQVSAATAQAVNAQRAAGGRIVAVGTTALRAIESAAREGVVYAADAETRLFIVPGHRFQVVDRLITNFHLPRSTLLMLVCAFAGLEPVKLAYRHAVECGYRFYSYGDAMLAERAR
ncbi:MAG TPA: tRNA preQ1(34) S-adenosylmethionine ribosyltransferase-isomerase QueA [Burkholderiaceae bacterium]